MSILFQDETHVDFCTLRRLEETKKFLIPDDFGIASYKISEYERARSSSDKDILDIGGRNYVGTELQVYLDRRFDNTLPCCDFNHFVHSPKDRYDVVVCFEVLEHIVNALDFLNNLNRKLNDNGILYISVPLAHPFGFMFNIENHYHEPHKHVLDKVFDYVGFEILSYKEFKTIPFWRGMYEGGGLFRTFLRVYFQKTGLWRLRKK